jgi:hypothetical protein
MGFVGYPGEFCDFECNLAFLCYVVERFHI